LAFAQADLLSKKKKENYWFNYDPDRKTLYFNYNNCRDEQDNPFANFNSELFTFIASHQPEKIILDLRYNNGGNSGILNPFIEKIKDSYLNRKGKFFVLIGKQTFSSAVMNAVDLKRNSNALFIGEATSGNINHYGEVRGFSLPKSKIVIAYSTRYWETWKGIKGPLKPDIYVKYSIKNYAEGRDEAIMQVYRK
jgi:C-terminal processing protease CtpA/Prc